MAHSQVRIYPKSPLSPTNFSSENGLSQTFSDKHLASQGVFVWIVPNFSV